LKTQEKRPDRAPLASAMCSARCSMFSRADAGGECCRAIFQNGERYIRYFEIWNEKKKNEPSLLEQALKKIVGEVYFGKKK